MISTELHVRGFTLTSSVKLRLSCGKGVQGNLDGVAHAFFVSGRTGECMVITC